MTYRHILHHGNDYGKECQMPYSTPSPRGVTCLSLLHLDAQHREYARSKTRRIGSLESILSLTEALEAL